MKLTVVTAVVFLATCIDAFHVPTSIIRECSSHPNKLHVLKGQRQNKRNSWSLSSSCKPEDVMTRRDSSFSYHNEEAAECAPIDQHWLEISNPIEALREGEITPFVWPDKEKKAPRPVDSVNLAKEKERLKSVTAIWDLLAEKCGSNPMLVDPSHGHNKEGSLTLSFAQSAQLIQQAAAGLHALRLRKGDHICLFSENSARWLITEQACAYNGCPTAVRGAAAPLEELQYIYEHSDSRAVVLQDLTLLQRLKKAGWLTSQHGAPRLVILLKPAESQILAELSKELKTPVVTSEEVLALGRKHLPEYRRPEVQPGDLHTLVYTSGTTGNPKGVMLTNANILHQIKHISLDNTDKMNPGPGDVVLSLLPCWHIFERSSELFALARGASLVYSSVRTFKADLQTYRPHFLIVVPRLLENVHKSIKDKFSAQPKVKRRLVALLTTLCIWYHRAFKRARGLVVRRRFKHNPAARLFSIVASLILWPWAKLADVIVWKKVRSALGGRQKLVVSGGSALAKYLEEFYQAAGISVVSGYGLTETSPVVAVRRADRNLVDGGVVGPPPREVELQVRDLETGEVVPDGTPGVVYTRGPQVMKGYYKNPEATCKTIDGQGFFCTGDVGFLNQGSGDLILTGRAKDIIVLNNGENVEPTPIEDVILERCPLIDQVMVVGQDQRFLGALVVVNPMALAERGLLDKQEAARLDEMVGPQAVLLGCKATSSDLDAEAAKLNANEKLVQAITKDISAAMTLEAEEFRSWEHVKGIRIILEPFNVQNGLLTQTLKVKRLSVAQRYVNQIKNIYS